jgi:uncharacterized protein YdeI (YjbR/CyaY-like superfamily)
MQTVYFIRRSEWREWLNRNHKLEKEIWFAFPKKASGRQSMSYNDAVEEALCFGWIDSTVKSLDDETKIQRFTPRKAKSNFSQANIERLRWLLERNLIQDDFVEEARAVVGKEFCFPEDIIGAISKDDQVWNNYSKLSDSYKRIRIAYINSARNRPEEFQKRLVNFVSKTRKGKIIRGYGGIEKYY